MEYDRYNSLAFPQNLWVQFLGPGSAQARQEGTEILNLARASDSGRVFGYVKLRPRTRWNLLEKPGKHAGFLFSHPQILRKSHDLWIDSTTIKIAFDPEASPEHPRAQLAGLGAPLIDAMLSDAATRDGMIEDWTGITTRSIERNDGELENFRRGSALAE